MQAYLSTRRSLGGALAVLVMVGGLFVLAGTASSQAGPSASCSDTILTLQAGFGDRGLTLYSDPAFGPDTRLRQLTAPLPAGSYAINAVSYDGYTDRATSTNQPDERWMARFLDANGNTLASTGSTVDLRDGVIEDTWTGSIGTVQWSGADAVAVLVVHAAPAGSTSPNSVEPVCVGATLNTPVQPAAAPTTTVAPKPAPSTSAATPDTTIVATVLPEVLPAPPALPQVQEPTFAG